MSAAEWDEPIARLGSALDAAEKSPDLEQEADWIHGALQLAKALRDGKSPSDAARSVLQGTGL